MKTTTTITIKTETEELDRVWLLVLKHNESKTWSACESRKVYRNLIDAQREMCRELKRVGANMVSHSPFDTNYTFHYDKDGFDGVFILRDKYGREIDRYEGFIYNEYIN